MSELTRFVFNCATLTVVTVLSIVGFGALLDKVGASDTVAGSSMLLYIGLMILFVSRSS